MNKLILAGLLAITAIVVGTLRLQPQLLSTIGLDSYIGNGSSSLADLVGESNNKKCTMADGEVIYGTITKPQDCIKIESIETHITILRSEIVEQQVNLMGDQSSHNTSDFNCDGRTRCSEMTSCEEARFFLDNCSNMQVDGDQDGVPCERQWC